MHIPEDSREQNLPYTHESAADNLAKDLSDGSELLWVWIHIVTFFY